TETDEALTTTTDGREDGSTQQEEVVDDEEDKEEADDEQQKLQRKEVLPIFHTCYVCEVLWIPDLPERFATLRLVLLTLRDHFQKYKALYMAAASNPELRSLVSLLPSPRNLDDDKKTRSSSSSMIRVVGLKEFKRDKGDG